MDNAFSARKTRALVTDKQLTSGSLGSRGLTDRGGGANVINLFSIMNMHEFIFNISCNNMNRSTVVFKRLQKSKQ